MTGLWLASYLVLWGLVIILCLLILGCLQQIGLLQRRIEGVSLNPEVLLPTIEDDGPPIGSSFPELAAETISKSGTVSLTAGDQHKGTLLVFISPLCETCQHLVDPLNAFVEKHESSERVVVILHADEQGCQAFLGIFPLRVPTICDSTHAITRQFDVHASPCGLLYDANGFLIRKGRPMRPEDLRALLGDQTVGQAARSRIFPQLESGGISEEPGKNAEAMTHR